MLFNHFFSQLNNRFLVEIEWVVAFHISAKVRKNNEQGTDLFHLKWDEVAFIIPEQLQKVLTYCLQKLKG